MRSSSDEPTQSPAANHELLYGQDLIWLDRTTPSLAIAGGVGSGKTYFACAWLHRGALEEPKATQWFCSDSDFLVKNVCFKTYQDLLDKWGYRKGPDYTTKANNYIRYANGSEVFFLSAKAWERWVGASLTAAVLDEPGRYPDGAFNEIYERLRGPKLSGGRGRQILFTGTPQGLTYYMEKFGGEDMIPVGPTYRYHGETRALLKTDQEGRKKVLHFPSFFNHTIDRQEQWDLLTSQYGHDDRLFRSHVLGEFCPLFSYNCYEMSDSNVIDCAPNEELRDVWISFDFNVGQMAATFWQQAKGVSYCVSELPARIENTDHACRETLKILPPDVWKNHRLHILGDATANRRDTRTLVNDYDILRATLRKYYTHVHVVVGRDNGSVRLRIQAVNRALRGNEYSGRGPVIFFDRECKRTIDSLYRTTYDQRGGIEKPSGDDWTHPSDTVGYYVCLAHPFKHVGSIGITY